MDKQKLLEIKNKLKTLDVLEEQLERLKKEISLLEGEVSLLSNKHKEESLNLEKLKSASLSRVFLRLIGKYESNIDEKSREVFSIKGKYDKSYANLKELTNKKLELNNKLLDLNNYKKIYIDELNKREKILFNNLNSEGFKKYEYIENQIKLLNKIDDIIKESAKNARRLSMISSSILKYFKTSGSSTYQLFFVEHNMTTGSAINDSSRDKIKKLHSLIMELKNNLTNLLALSKTEFGENNKIDKFLDMFNDQMLKDLSRGYKNNQRKQIINLIQSNAQTVAIYMEEKEKNIQEKIDKAKQAKEEILITLVPGS